ncbi:unnamed protein product [Pseudo-nitzschia multistriata]|uniref:Uncharacterized protein n=1 Tax=Pseudo-nitzschia multistriata TaxID=183589 RepID=A0A448ZF82_9STRA|nr:unnamed protein product [Pseudo-nitzschia multistriata]
MQPQTMLPVGDDNIPAPHSYRQPTKAVKHGRPLSPNTLDKDIDEEYLLGIPAPPPPPTPPPGRRGGSKQHLVSTSPSDPSNPTSPRQKRHQRQQQPPESPLRQTPKEQSACDSTFHENDPSNESTPTTLPKTKKVTKPSANSTSATNQRTPKTRTPQRKNTTKTQTPTFSKSAEYGSRLESFHQVMLENIEKEALLMRRQGATPGTPPRNHSRGSSSSGRKASDYGSSGNNGVESLLKETMNDISSAAASTMKTLQSAIQHTKERASAGNLGAGNAGPAPIVCVSIHQGEAGDDSFGETGNHYPHNANDDDDLMSPMATARKETRENQRSAASKQHASNRHPRMAASLPGVEHMPMLNSSSGAEMMKRMGDALKKVVVDATAGANNHQNNNDVQRRNDRGDRRGSDENENDWGVGNILANGFGWDGEEDDDDDDQRSRATYDTWDDENSVLRRLGSWGTVNSQYTAGTTGTAATFGTMATYDTGGDTEGGLSVVGPVSAAVAAASAAKLASAANGDQSMAQGGAEVFRDDNGQRIDPLLIERAMKKQQQNLPKESSLLGKKSQRKSRRQRRKKVVKFDYPPIKSLRQYTRPDPEDLPKLFFTEDELDQIEDDRYSTMSTDDIEIVAVSSKEGSSINASADDGDAAATDGDTRRNTKKCAAGKKKSSGGDEEYELGCKPVKGRSGTPIRRRARGGDDDVKQTHSGDTSSNGPRSPRRLVKGVQIYLRERSTGA